MALNIDIRTTQIPALDQSKIGLLVEVIATNKGKGAVSLDLQNEPLSISLLTRHTNGELYSAKRYTPYSYTDVKNDWNELAIGQGVQPGTSKIIEFYEELENEGVYFISFKSFIDQQVKEQIVKAEVGLSDHEVSLNDDRDFDSRTAWRAQKYVHIKKP